MAEPRHQALVRMTDPATGEELFYPVKLVSMGRFVDRAVGELRATLTHWHEDYTFGREESLTFRRGLARTFAGVDLFLRTEELPVGAGALSPAELDRATRLGALDSDTKLFTGRLDRLEVDATASSGVSEIRIAARTLGADLVDSTLPPDFVGSVQAASLSDLFAAICDHYGVPAVVPEGPPSEVETFALSNLTVAPTETAIGLLQRVAQIDGRLIFPTPDGLALAPAGEGPEGAAIEVHQSRTTRMAYTRQTQERFAAIEVVEPGDGDLLSGLVGGGLEGLLDDGSGAAAAIDQGGGPSTRRLLLRSESGADPEALQRRAEWEVATRVARSETLSVQAHGWLMLTGGTGGLRRPWPLNRRTHVSLPAIDLEAPLLIGGLELTLDESGFSTQVILTREAAYLPQPVVEEESFGGDFILGGSGQ